MGAIIFNHVHAESDNVKVIGWGRDPFTNLPMPICVLKYSSIQYKKDNGDVQEDVKVLEGFRMLNAHQHGVIDSQRKALDHLKALLKSKFDNVGDILSLAREIADVDIELFSKILKPRKTGRLAQLGKALMYVAMIGGIVLIVWIIAFYLFGVWMPFFE